MLQRAGVRANVNCISAGNSLLLERVLSQWTYDIKGKAGFKGRLWETARWRTLAPQAGFEPATRCLEGSRSIP